MRIVRRGVTTALMGLCLLATSVPSANAEEAPVNIAGTWKITVARPDRNIEQTIELKQEGKKVTGSFKGPRQSGTLEGTVEGAHIKFHVKAHVSMDYAGTIAGDTMKGTLSARGESSEWLAKRTK